MHKKIQGFCRRTGGSNYQFISMNNDYITQFASWEMHIDFGDISRNKEDYTSLSTSDSHGGLGGF